MPTITIDPAIAADIEKFEVQLERYLSGDLAEDAFRVFRLNNGIYGQRQGGTNQMVRVKLPYGSVTPDQLDAFAHAADEYSRGWGHITTRQNMQFHFVQLENIPAMMRDLGAAGSAHPTDTTSAAPPGGCTAGPASASGGPTVKSEAQPETCRDREC